MLNIIKADLEGENLKLMKDLFENIENGETSVEKSLRQIDRDKAQLEVIRQELLKVLTIKLDTIKSKHFLTLSEFLYPKRLYTELNRKLIKKDFLFLFYDSLKKVHILHPEDVTALFIYKRMKKVDAENIKNYTETYLRKSIEKLMNAKAKHNWMGSIEKADSLYILRQDDVLIVPTFIYLINNRRTHSKMKINNCYVFKRTGDTERLFFLRDAILKIFETVV